MRIPFTKMHGLGNDFILLDYVHELKENFEYNVISQRLCHRRFGIGADQLLILSPSEIADFKMRIFNADGSEVEMCGNGIRCLAKYIWDKGLSKNDFLKIETLAGIIKPEKRGEMVRVDMGEPMFEPDKIPVKLPIREGYQSQVIDYPIRIKDKEFKVTCISMGNPHAVIFIEDDLPSFPLDIYGPAIENHEYFPKRINVEFVKFKSKNDLNMRVWERGAGETMACGTGASAAAIAAMVKKLTERKVFLHLLGGDLFIEWEMDNHVYMTGPAVTVFEGVIEI